MPQLYWIIPLEGGGGQIDNTLPGGPPGHISNRPPGSWGGHPDAGLPGGPPDHVWWGGGRPDRPDQGLPGHGHPDNSLPPGAEPRGTEVPLDVYTPAPIPEEIISQFVVTVYNPKTQTYTTKTYPPR